MSNRVEVTRSRLAGASAQLRASPSRQYLPPLSPPAQQDAQADSSHQPVGRGQAGAASPGKLDGEFQRARGASKRPVRVHPGQDAGLVDMPGTLVLRGGTMPRTAGAHRAAPPPRRGPVLPSALKLRIAFFYISILFGLIVEGFGALVRTDAGVCSGCNEIERILAVLVPGAVQIATLIVSTLLFLVVCKDTVFLRLGVYHAFHAEFWPVLYSFVLAFVCSSGFMVFRIFRAGVDAESYKDEWQDPLYVVAFVLERVSIMVYCSAASVGVFRALSPPLYTKACLLRELRDAEEAGEDGGEALVRGAS